MRCPGQEHYKMSNKEFNILVNIDDRRGIQEDNLMPQ